MRAKKNTAALAVEEWDSLWREWLQARAAGDFARIERVRRQIEAYDRKHGTQSLRVTREA